MLATLDAPGNVVENRRLAPPDVQAADFEDWLVLPHHAAPIFVTHQSNCVNDQIRYCSRRDRAYARQFGIVPDAGRQLGIPRHNLDRRREQNVLSAAARLNLSGEFLLSP